MGLWGANWETRAQGLYHLQKKMFSDPRDLRVKAGEAWVGHSTPPPHTHIQTWGTHLGPTDILGRGTGAVRTGELRV